MNWDMKARASNSLLLLAVGLALALGLLPGSLSLVTSQSAETPPRFANYEPPAPMGRSAGEPSLGISHKIMPPALRGRVMYIAGLETLRVTYDDCTSPATDLWEDVSPPTTPPATLDPILWTDSETGRTFSSQLAGKTSVMSFTDDEGVTWMQSQGSGINSGVDHQTVGGGPYPAGDLGSINAYPNAVYYCSQDVAVAQCALSRDGGLTFGPAVPIYNIGECGGLHGQVQVAPDGTTYVPNNSCNRGGDPFDLGEPGFARSSDAGITWEVKTVPGAQSIGSSDPAIGIGEFGTLYFGYEDRGSAKVAVSQNRGDTWPLIRDVSSPLGIKHIVFPQVVAGNDNRAAIAFLGTDYSGPGDPEGEDTTLPAVWHLYIAATYDGGGNWVSTNATPGDPVQRGAVCGLGAGCTSARNLLDFNDITIDRTGRIHAAYADGCISGCVNGPPNSGTDVAKIARQVSGKGLLAAFDPDGTEAPAAVRLQATFGDGQVNLSWDEPDDRGTPITNYKVYRRRTDIPLQPQTLLATLPAQPRAYTDSTIVAGQTYAYEVTAVNANGEGARCREVVPVIPPPRNPCDLPGDLVITDPAMDTSVPAPALDILSLHVAEPRQADRLNRLVFTLKVTDLTVPLIPNHAWVILWNRPFPDSSFDRNYVAMRVDPTGTARFKYGQISPPSVNQGFDMGDADSGTFSATDDTIVITISTTKIDDVAAGQDIAGLEVRTFASNVSGQPVTQLTSTDFTASSFYTLVGNAFCDPAPLAVDDSAITPENQPVTINVLANDTDSNGDPLTVIHVTDPPHGSAGINADGTVTYTPDLGFVGTDSFDYTISDPGGLTDVGTVRVIVFRSPPVQSPIQDDAAPDQVDGIDKDGNYRLSWTFPPPPDSQPCMFQIEEASTFSPLFSDDAQAALVAGENARWSADPRWISSAHPDTGTLGYSVVYTDQLNVSLTMKNAVAIPAGPTRALLLFDSFEDIEESFDFAIVEASANGGPFQTLDSYTGFFSGRRAVNLSSFAGSSIKIRFRFSSDLLISAPLFLGWFIDNVEIQTADFFAIGTVSGSTYQLDVTNRPSGTYFYRIAGLFGTGCTQLGPYSNIHEITVDREDLPQLVLPTADFTVTPNPALVNQTVTFDGRASHDNDGLGSGPPIVRYFWSFGDGATQTTSDPMTTHSYSAPGTYRATLTVTDNDGQTAAAEMFVEVTEAPVPGEQKATGGGWIARGSGRANFGFNAKKQGTEAPSGHLNYHDKGGSTKVTTDSISSLVITGNKATFSGACSINKKSGFTFTVEVVDNGEPGTSDTFMIRLSNGYQAGGTLGGGNIQVRSGGTTSSSHSFRLVD